MEPCGQVITTARDKARRHQQVRRAVSRSTIAPMASQIVRDTFSQAAQLNKPQNEPHTTREVQRGVGKEQVGFSTYRPILDAIVKAAKREGMTKTAWLDIAVIAVLRERYPDLYDMVRARRHEVTASRRDASQIPIDPE